MRLSGEDPPDKKDRLASMMDPTTAIHSQKMSEKPEICGSWELERPRPQLRVSSRAILSVCRKEVSRTSSDVRPVETKNER